MTKIAFIGGGTMGEAIIGAALERRLYTPEDMVLAEPMAPRRTLMKKQYGVQVTDNDLEAVQDAAYIVFAVKPQEFEEAAAAIDKHLPQEAVIISIMAGVRIEALHNALGHGKIVRVMPNTPAQIGQGMSIWCATEGVARAQREAVRDLLHCMGREIEVAEEKYIDMATAVSGSGPGFVFLLLEAMIDGAVHIGLPRQMAKDMVLQTFLGSTLFAQRTDRHLAELRDLVTSPGGTTAAGLQAMERHGIRGTIGEAVVEAYERARELGGK